MSYLEPLVRAIEHTTSYSGRRLIVEKDGRIAFDQTHSFSLPYHSTKRAYRSRNSSYRVLPDSSKSFLPSTLYINGSVSVQRTGGIFRSDAGGFFWEWRGDATSLGGDTYAFTGPWLNQFGEPSQMSGNTLNRLKTEVLNKMGARKVSYGEAIGESRQTIKHLAKTTSVLVRSLLYARRGNWKGVLDQLGLSRKTVLNGKVASERWLELQYGWLPLVSDIHSTVGLLQEGFRKEAQLLSSVRRLTDNHSTFINNGDDGYREISIIGSSKRADIMKVYFYVNPSDLSKINQIGLLNPLEIAWALTPYSFVVDWLLPVGNVLEALTATVGLTFVSGYFSSYVEGNYNVVPRPCGYAGEKVIRNDLRVSTSGKGYVRSPLGGFPTPGLYLKSPFSSTHVTSALALLRQLKR